MSLLFRLLTSEMDKSNFTCGDTSLDSYLKKQASQDMKRNFSTVIVASETSNPQGIIGFYTLCAASIVLTSLPEEIAQKMPKYPTVPAIRLGRLAVHKDKQRQHLGSLLLMDALYRSCKNEMAWAAFLVDAKNEQAVTFYKKFLFQPFIENTLTLWMHRKQAERLTHQYDKNTRLA